MLNTWEKIRVSPAGGLESKEPNKVPTGFAEVIWPTVPTLT